MLFCIDLKPTWLHNSGVTLHNIERGGGGEGTVVHFARVSIFASMTGKKNRNFCKSQQVEVVVGADYRRIVKSPNPAEVD